MKPGRFGQRKGASTVKTAETVGATTWFHRVNVHRVEAGGDDLQLNPIALMPIRESNRRQLINQTR